MKKILVVTGLLLAALQPVQPAEAQILAGAVPEFPLPNIAGPVIRPQNAGSSTMQNVFYQSVGANNNLYVHCWDLNGNYYNGIAWRRTNMGGGLEDEGFLQIDHAADIDVALFESAGRHYVLAGYYYNDGAGTFGHYYDIYEFTPTGLIPASTMNLLTATPVFGRINVDANTPYGLAVTWCVPGTGIYLKVATTAGLVGPNVLIPGTANYKDPDICIGHYAGNLSVYVAYITNTNIQIPMQQLDFNTVLAGATTGIILLNTSNAPVSGTLGLPRIDCPDDYPVQKWACVYPTYPPSGGSALWETIQIVIKNQAWSSFLVGLPIHFGSYTGTFQETSPVLAYNDNADIIHVGWITKESTTAIANNTDCKYVAQDISDPGGTMPAPVFSSFMMISNTPAGPFPVLAFSGQDNTSSFNGVHAAYAQVNAFIGGYAMMYKDKPWTTPTYKVASPGNTSMQLSVIPNPFIDQISLSIPKKGLYNISITSADGRKVYQHNGHFEYPQQLDIPAANLVPGIYFIQAGSLENNILFSQKLVKQ
jgi:hypothetical protein